MHILIISILSQSQFLIPSNPPWFKVRAEYRQIFLEMGFTEMPTNNYVESSFWNFDALFQVMLVTVEYAANPKENLISSLSNILPEMLTTLSSSVNPPPPNTSQPTTLRE